MKLQVHPVFTSFIAYDKHGHIALEVLMDVYSNLKAMIAID